MKNIFLFSLKRTVRNTIISLLLSLFSIIISLISVRYIYISLGAENFGLFNIIWGLIAVLSFFQVAIQNSAERFMAYYIGKNKKNKIESSFFSFFIISISAALILSVLLKIFGSIYINNYLMNVSDLSIFTSHKLLNFAVLVLLILCVKVPFNAILIAYEKIILVSSINLVESFLKLIIAFLLFKLKFGIVFYGLCLFISTLLITIFLIIYVNNKIIPINNLKPNLESEFLKSFSFSIWNLFGNFGYVSRTQGSNLILNQFFNPAINASFSISERLNQQSKILTQYLTISIKPQIYKLEGNKQRKTMIFISMFLNKICFTGLMIIIIPFMINFEYIIKTWLGEIPPFLKEFLVGFFILTLQNQMSQGNMAILQAIGKIKKYQIIAGLTHISVIPIGYYFFKLNNPAYLIVYISVILEFFVVFYRAFLIHKFTKYSFSLYLFDFTKAFVTIFILSIILTNIFINPESFSDLVMSFVTSCILIFILTPYLLLNTKERNLLINELKKIYLTITNEKFT